MKSWLQLTALTAMMALGTATHAQPVEMEGQKFEPTVQVGGQTLMLNGVGLRKRAFFKVYVNGLYVPTKSKDAATLINEKGARRASLRMLRDVGADIKVDVERVVFGEVEGEHVGRAGDVGVAPVGVVHLVVPPRDAWDDIGFT